MSHFIKIKNFIVILLCISITLMGEAEPWVVYYGTESEKEALDPYNPIVLHNLSHPPLAPLLKQGKEVLGYLNIGEVDQEQEWFFRTTLSGLLIKENPYWAGSWSVDIRSYAWKHLLLKHIIPQILAQGFTGLLLDQIDIALTLEEHHPFLYRGMGKAAITLIHAIRKEFPHIRRIEKSTR